MQAVIFAAVGVLLIVAENAWNTFLPFDLTAAQFGFVWILSLGLLDYPIRGAVFAFAVGFIHDSLVGSLPGLDAAVYTTAYFFMMFSGKAFFPRSVIFHVIAVAGLTVIAVMLRSFFLFIFPSCDPMIGFSMADLPMQTLMNCAAAIAVFPFMFRLDDLTGPKRENIYYLPSSW